MKREEERTTRGLGSHGAPRGSPPCFPSLNRTFSSFVVGFICCWISSPFDFKAKSKEIKGRGTVKKIVFPRWFSICYFRPVFGARKKEGGHFCYPLSTITRKYLKNVEKYCTRAKGQTRPWEPNTDTQATHWIKHCATTTTTTTTTQARNGNLTNQEYVWLEY